VGYLYCIGNPRTDWLFNTVEEPGLGGRSIKYPRGRVWGGCSSINGMIYMRGQAADYDRWAEVAPGWSWSDVLPYFRKHEDYYRLDGGGSDPLHGHGGEWRVEAMRVRWPILDAFREAAAEAGIPPTEDFNRGNNFGCGYFEVNQRRGVRWNASRAFLRPVLGRPNLKVASSSNVARLVFDPDEAGKVIGVEYQACPPRQALSPSGLGPVTEARARREVVPPARSARCRSSNGPASATASACASSVSRCGRTFPAWAKTCRITSSCARSTR
jgi:choline dehydrogenase